MKAYIALLVAITLWNVPLLAAPISAYLGMDEAASFFYNIYKFQGHQWIYRSICIFEDGSVGDCIPHGKESKAEVETRFTDAPKEWDGMFIYDRAQIAVNRADTVLLEGKRGFKFAACARNTAIYLSAFLGTVAAYFLNRRGISLPYGNIAMVLALIPLGIDGTGQLIGLWESTNLSRLITGAITGFTIFVYLAESWLR